MDSKITPDHLGRAAVVYVRQSTMAQVMGNLESQRRQYDGERATAIYSIIETCKLNGVEPFAYISGVMQKIGEGWPNSRIDELMPWVWSPVAQQRAA
jgi:IS66 C-terminal element